MTEEKEWPDLPPEVSAMIDEWIAPRLRAYDDDEIVPKVFPTFRRWLGEGRRGEEWFRARIARVRREHSEVRRERPRLIPDWPAAYAEIVAELRRERIRLTWGNVTTRAREHYPQAESLSESTVRQWSKQDQLPHPAKVQTTLTAR